ncbi:hypothetical protein BC332_17898 [Capsicum chinense]|nr:hypothetical protein BC332_17898 [Capsicum chinense]
MIGSERIRNFLLIDTGSYLSWWQLVSELRQSRDKKGINDQILKATHVTYYQGHYVASFMIGSERIRNFLLIDTGSYLSWWQCAPCLPNKCYKQAFNAIYNYTTSTTFKHMDCVDESGRLNSVFRRLCMYAQTYDNGEKTKGFLGSDIITFLGDNTQARIIFGCGIDQKSGTSEYGNTYSGIIALGKRLSARTPGIYSLPSQLGTNLFALCLPSAEAATGSFITFNKAPWVHGTEAKLLKNRQQPHLYYINLYKIFINDREVPVDPTWWNGRKEDHGVIVDTGSLITRFPHDYYIIFRYIFREQVHYPLYPHNIGGVFDTCYEEVNKTAIAQTRKAFMAFDTSNLKDPPMPPNSVSVYHLDLLEKSKFKDYDSLFTHRLAQDQARATFLSRGKSSVSNSSGIYDQILKATHVTYYQGHYVALFMLGSERVRNFLLIDTGNYLSWWQCEPCSPNKCYKQAFNAIYKYTESSTYKKLDCVAESGCLNSVFQCNVDLRLCFYTQTYDNGEKTIGFLATDIITFVGDNTQARITFGCGVNQVSGTGQFANTYSGIIALGKRLSSRNPGIYSLPSQLGSNLFALCLPTAEAATGSFLTFNKAPWVYVFQCNVDLRLCFYTQTYDNGEKTIGFLATDIITFVGDNTQARITFGCGVNLVSGTGQFANTYSGIIALGKRLSSRNPGIYSLPSQLGSNLFALCFPTAEAATGSFLTFNKAPWVYGTEAKILKNRQEPHYYYVNLYKIFINDREVPVDPTWWNGQKEDHGAFVDTGTLISRFPHDYYIIFRYAFRAQVHYPLYQHSIGGVFDTCYKEIDGEEEMQFPSVRLFFGNVSVTQELKLEQDRVVKNINGYYCLAFLPWDLKLTLIGTQQLQGTGLTFDMKNNVLTFSVDACD